MNGFVAENAGAASAASAKTAAKTANFFIINKPPY
jgi:hypothetical protein